MAVAPIAATPPTKTPVVNADRLVHATWLLYFNVVTEFIRQFITFKEASETFVTAVTTFMSRYLRFDIPYDPPSIGAGLAHTQDVTVSGVKVGDIVGVSFQPAAAGMTLLAQATATNTVSVTFLNVSGGAIDLGSGTIRLSVETV